MNLSESVNAWERTRGGRTVRLWMDEYTTVQTRLALPLERFHPRFESSLQWRGSSHSANGLIFHTHTKCDVNTPTTPLPVTPTEIQPEQYSQGRVVIR